MIANRQEFEVTLRQLRSVERALDILRQDLKDAGPALQAAAPGAYERRIASLQEEIAAYLYEHPADLSLLTRDDHTLAHAS
jgi:hypothetical protein